MTLNLLEKDATRDRFVLSKIENRIKLNKKKSYI